MPMPPMGFEYEKVEPPKSFRDLFRFLREVIGGFCTRLFYIFRLVWETGPWILITQLLIAVFEGILPILIALLSKNVLNELQGVIEQYAKNGEGFEIPFWGSTVMFLLIFVFSLRIFNRVISRVSAATTRIAGEKVVKHVKYKIMKKTEELDLASFDLPQFYEKLENANREAGMRPINILQSSFSVISTIISLVSYIVILSAAVPIAAVCIFVVSVPGAIINFYYRRKNFQYLRLRSKDRRQMNYYADVLVNKDMAKEIRIFHLSELFISKYNEVFDHYYRGLRKLILKENILHVVVTIISSVVSCFFFGVVAFRVFQGKLKIGDYSLLTGSITNIANDVNTLISTSAAIYEGTLFIDNLISFLKEKRTVVPTLDEPAKVDHGAGHTFDFEHVSFCYPGTDKYVIKDVNLHFRPGETVVLVGLNGAGKTTLIKLMTRLYDPTEGRILLDGRDIREYDTADLYSMFGIIFQDFGKYAFTVSENIHLGESTREWDDGEIRDAAVSANAHDYIMSLPNGYDTPLMRVFEPNGRELSGGQWQKIAIARAFYSHSDVMILDEPTAALDPMAEQEIFNQFDRLRADKTTVFVSHRLSSATIASKIVVLEYGQVIEEGTHKELMEKHGKYYELFTTQASRYLENAEPDGEEPASEHRPHHHRPE